MSKVKLRAAATSYSDRFMHTLRQTLEHINDAEWLERHSTLAAVPFAGATPLASRRRQIGHMGRKEVDERLRTIWHVWEARAKSRLQSTLWEAVCHLPYDLETPSQALLLLTYFEDPRPQQREVIQLLALGRSTYYRYLDQAVETLSALLVQMLRPALRLEQPTVRPLVGRVELAAQAYAALRSGRVVHLVGGSGLGKASLGAQLAAQWPAGRTFWYTVRPGLTDRPEQMLFALAYFCHLQGASNLWLLLNTSPQELDFAKALAVLRYTLAELPEPSLFCFDDVDLLLNEDPDGRTAHHQSRLLLDDLVRSPRSGAAILLIGQKLLLEPEPGLLLALTPFAAGEVAALLNAMHLSLEHAQQEQLIISTGGNPLLLRLYATLQQFGASLDETLTRLSAPVTLEWFVARLHQHLAPAAQTLLAELSVFEGSAPRAGWRAGQKTIRTLVELGLVAEIGADRLALHPALRPLFYQLLPPDRQRDLHLAAAAVCSEQALFTQAARHYLQGGRPELALWTWYTYRQQEISQGQAGAALALFAPLAADRWPVAEDQRALALLLAELSGPAGHTAEGLAALDRVHWLPHQPSTVRAHELRGALLADLGEIDRSLAEYRRSLEVINTLRATQTIHLHSAIARRALVYLGERELARMEVTEARFDLEVLQGEIEDEAGNYAAAAAHYQAALQLADLAGAGDDHRPAKVHEALGILEARHLQLAAAVEHLEAAGRHYAATGNLVCSIGVTNTNVSYAHLLARRYAEAIPHAQRALAFFQEINHPYWLALNEANLAEASLYLDELDQAEEYAQRGLRREEAVVRPYCLYVLGAVRCKQERLGEAERFGREAITAGEGLQDPWALGPAWRTLAATFSAGARWEDARLALAQTIQIYRQLGVEAEVAITQALLAGLPPPSIGRLT
ncbi:MAG TPA: hypothetical protein PKE45_12165 [Caldilineaceae bacterium]|nr:hypothetical protein [Caldilineaceae bacterium]